MAIAPGRAAPALMGNRRGRGRDVAGRVDARSLRYRAFGLPDRLFTESL